MTSFYLLPNLLLFGANIQPSLLWEGTQRSTIALQGIIVGYMHCTLSFTLLFASASHLHFRYNEFIIFVACTHADCTQTQVFPQSKLMKNC